MRSPECAAQPLGRSRVSCLPAAAAAYQSMSECIPAVEAASSAAVVPLFDKQCLGKRDSWRFK